VKNTFINKIDTFLSEKKRVYFSGLIVILGITLKEVLAHSTTNFQIFSYGSLDFWSGKNPYLNWDHLSLLGRALDRFLYGPLFSVLFTPFALLPIWLGPFCWNIFTYSLFCYSVFNLPERFSFLQKRFIFLYSALLLFASMLSLQFNPVVAAIFLLSFALLEKDKGFLAVLLIMLSGFIKIYGFFQLAIIFFYPGLLKKIFYAAIIAVVLILIPAINIPFQNLSAYYQNWFSTLTGHLDTFKNYSIFRLPEFFSVTIGESASFISVSVFLLLFGAAMLRIKTFRESFLHRARFVAIIMGWVILFSTGSERHTYIIAVAGYIIWYLSIKPSLTDKILLWINFILLGIVPVDIFCPVSVSEFILDKLFLNVVFFAITWGIMVYKTFSKEPESISF
jgi:hypothetical protein